MNSLYNFLSNQLVTIIALVGLIVLTAMGKVQSDVTVPAIVGLAGVHIGGKLSTPTGG